MTAPIAKLHCIVPGCSRALAPLVVATDAGGLLCQERICATHWRLVPPPFKAVYRRATKRLQTDTRRQLGAWTRLWNRCKRAAIERSVGI